MVIDKGIFKASQDFIRKRKKIYMKVYFSYRSLTLKTQGPQIKVPDDLDNKIRSNKF